MCSNLFDEEMPQQKEESVCIHYTCIFSNCCARYTSTPFDCIQLRWIVCGWDDKRMSDPKSKPVLMTYIRGLIQTGQVTNINYNYISLHLFLAHYCVCVLMTVGLDVLFCVAHFSSFNSMWVETKTEKIEQQIFSEWGFRGICKLERQILLHSSDLAVLRPRYDWRKQHC